jgi:hypothetical protein
MAAERSEHTLEQRDLAGEMELDAVLPVVEQQRTQQRCGVRQREASRRQRHEHRKLLIFSVRRHIRVDRVRDFPATD